MVIPREAFPAEERGKVAALVQADHRSKTYRFFLRGVEIPVESIRFVNTATVIFRDGSSASFDSNEQFTGRFLIEAHDADTLEGLEKGANK